MQNDRSRWKTEGHSSEVHEDFLRNSVQRRNQLEKILFSYNNLHRLDPSYGEIVQRAFESNDPIALWNFENEVLLNSKDVDDLMQQQFAAPVQNNQCPNPYQNCGYQNNLVSTLDASFKVHPFAQHGNYMPPPAQFASNPNVFPQPVPPYTMDLAASNSGFAHPQIVNQPMHPHVPVGSQNYNPPQFVPAPPTMMPVGAVMVSQGSYSMSPPQIDTSKPPSGYGFSSPIFPSPSYSQYSGPPANEGFPDIIYDNNGVAYCRVVSAPVCVVSMSQSGSSVCSSQSFSSGQSDISMSSRPPINGSSVGNGSLSPMTDSVREESEDEDYGTLTPVGQQDCDLDSVDTESVANEPEPYSSTMSEMPPLDDVDDIMENLDLSKTLIEPETLEHSDNMSVVEIKSEPVSEMTTDSLIVDDDRDTSISEIIKYLDTSDDVLESWQEATGRKKCFVPQKTQKLVYPLPLSKVEKPLQKCQQTLAASTIDEDSKEASTIALPDARKKLTKKEKRLMAAQKANQLETDDDVLEAAYRERQKHVEQAGGDYSSSGQKDQKKKRGKRPVSNPPPSLISPQILHAVQMAIANRAKKISESGRPIFHENFSYQKFYETVDTFVKTWEENSNEMNKVLQFIEKRILAFKMVQRPQSLSRITIYEQLQLNLPPAILPELCFLAGLTSDSTDKLEYYEEIFFNLF
ncbi:uncharacterized protein CELE_C02F12.8 [Caenorhabditis elegans]|uniref:Uncharacterized protein C02F12.8 n=1 Tax=Caenorhabditis elegans TaxID=6239 RepID=YL18_CAEEL|nr:Uncharacterized protein CELE_C02F12.8 [Caenorhabditis elegans]Q11103.1 RecName: Full=Uncharacterized protein C02F12.8 [Caenorhabditis elegans]CCD62376.1 Uncharacterized protein CELE_C02F12.8 [Caenorhabditis elegans]|eukprot:NP_508636.1 Uncharacterized protein CELE_C02F12.8 [Caenorhabditis elegans]